MAETNTTATTTADNSGNATATTATQGDGNSTPDYKALFEKAVAERDRFKIASDNLSAENAAYKRKEREALTESERTQADDAEKEQS